MVTLGTNNGIRDINSLVSGLSSALYMSITNLQNPERRLNTQLVQ